MPQGVGLHTWAVTACGGTTIADKASLATAKVMAATAYDLIWDPALRAAARKELESRLNGRTYTSPLPKDRLQPFTLPAHLTKSGNDEVIKGLVG